MLRVEACHSFYPLPVYATATVGFNDRTNGLSEEFHFGFEPGYTVKSKALLTLKMYGVESLKNDEPVGFTGNGIFSNNTEYLSVRPGLAYYLNKNWGIAGEIGFAPRGERILASPSDEFGIFFNW